MIEAVVDPHGFNDQRHQFKPKTRQITACPPFTKVVAWLPAEATTLRDRYAKLSTTEHDDPRTAYVHPDKAMFRTRYNQFLGIETAIRGRIPVQAMRPIDWEHPAHSAFLSVNQPL